MPHTRTSDPGTRRERVPAGIFLPDPHRLRISRHRRCRLAAWHDLQPWDLAHLIVTYTRAADIVVNAEAHRTVELATRYLRRHPATVTFRSGRARINAEPSVRRTFRRNRGAGLVLATLPDPTTTETPDPRSPLAALTAWRRLLRPGGFLVVALPEHPGTPAAGGSVRGLVIAAARTAGLVYQQHLLVVTRPLAEDEPRATPEGAGTVPPMLRAGRHARIHRDLLAFAATTVRRGCADA